MYLISWHSLLTLSFPFSCFGGGRLLLFQLQHSPTQGNFDARPATLSVLASVVSGLTSALIRDHLHAISATLATPSLSDTEPQELRTSLISALKTTVHVAGRHNDREDPPRSYTLFLPSFVQANHSRISRKALLHQPRPPSSMAQTRKSSLSLAGKSYRPYTCCCALLSIADLLCPARKFFKR